MGRPQQSYSENQRKEVRKAYRASKDIKEKDRLLCLRLRIERAYASKQIADIVDCREGFVKKSSAIMAVKGYLQSYAASMGATTGISAMKRKKHCWPLFCPWQKKGGF